MTRLLVATRNLGKLAEVRRVLAPLVAGIELAGLDELPAYAEPAETAATFAGNALIKARAAVAHTGLPALADDSGICVDALGGRPGVRSARWSGPDKDDRRNNALLLEQLRDVPDERRGAEFRCSVAFCRPDGAEDVVHGVMRGRVVRAPRGSGGFGYDVVFAPQGYHETTAELPAEVKDRLSHRGQALRAMVPVIAAWSRS